MRRLARASHFAIPFVGSRGMRSDSIAAPTFLAVFYSKDAEAEVDAVARHSDTDWPLAECGRANRTPPGLDRSPITTADTHSFHPNRFGDYELSPKPGRKRLMHEK